MLGLATRCAPRAVALWALLLAACPASVPSADAGRDASADAPASAPDAAVIDAAPTPDAAPDACPPPTRRCGDACVDTSADPEHCGWCDHRCAPLAGSIAFCASSLCVSAVCRPGFGNCDMDRDNGCEVDVDTSVEHCGRCGHSCEAATNAHPVCELGDCTLACDPGWSDCDVSVPGCECAI